MKILRRNLKKYAIPFFKYRELVCPCCRLFRFNMAGLLALHRLRILYDSPIKCSSGTRCDSHNIEVGGHDDSQHKEGSGFDLIPRDKNHLRLQDYAKVVGFRDVIYYVKTNHVHVEF